MENYNEIITVLNQQKCDIITINDGPNLSEEDFIKIKPLINQALDNLLPNKSTFEI